MQIDVLLVGQGLAGSLLAWELTQRKFRVLVVDNGAENASRVAAGVVNPVTGQRLVIQPNLEQLLPAAMALYRQLAEYFRQEFYVAMPMLKIIRSAKERALVEQRLVNTVYQHYLDGWFTVAQGMNAPNGVLRQRHTGYLKTELLLNQLRDFLTNKGCYRQEEMNFSDIRLEPDLAWRGIEARHIVFCEGHRALANPWFGGLPFQVVKGEILGCESHADLPRQILNYGHWLVPVADRQFKTGASFEPGRLDPVPTPQARQILLDSLNSVCPGYRPVNIFQHRAGIRPATLDKHPFIGTHPRYRQLHIFNGFGAKGSLTIPWYAAKFADYLLRRGDLPLGSDIRRYHATHFPA